MSQGSSKSFVCPHCQKRFQWSTQIADRKAQCPNCAKKIRIPTVPGRIAEAVDPLPQTHQPEPQPESDTYDLDLTGIDESIVDAPPSAAQQSAAQTGRCPACNQSINPSAVICIKCGYDLKKGKRMQTDVAEGDKADKPRTKNTTIPETAMPSIGASPISRALEDHDDEAEASSFVQAWLPLILILVGLGVRLIEQLNFAANPTEGIISALIVIGAELIINVPMLLVGMIIAVKALDVSFGPLGQALYKMVAVIIGPTALAAIMAYLIGGIMGSFVGWFISFGAYWTLLSVFFDLEGMEALRLIIILWVLDILMTFIILGVILSLIFA
jgi:DNA-directed RNA polymerase subunit RPC12/RpoP